MYNKRINYVVVGLFVTAMSIAGITSVAVIAGRTGPTDPYYILLDNVTDVKFGTQVRHEGYPIGQVERIAPASRPAGMRFRVDLSVERGWRIPGDSVARIGSSSFLAAKSIDIDGGEAAEPVPVGGEIASAAPSDMFTTITAAASGLSELNRTSIKPLLTSLHGLIDTVDAGAPRITEQLASFAERLNAVLTPLEDILAEKNVAAVGRTLGNVEEMTAVLATTSRDLAGTLGKIDNLVANIDRLVADNQDGVDQSLKDAQYTLASIARTVDTIVHNMEGTARNMNEFSRLIRQNPGLLLDGRPRVAATSDGPAQTGSSTRK